jgi:outer membrane protein assembly factor BamA
VFMRFGGVFLCLLLLSAYTMRAQPRAAGRKSAASGVDVRWKLASVEVTGTQRYTKDEILGASGLQLGQPVSEDDFKKATESLGQTGLFNNVSYSYSYSSSGAKLELQLSDDDHLVPAKLENFVWWADQDLLAKLRERVPLFKGLLPLTGEMTDQISNALQTLLIEQKVKGVADYTQVSHGDGPVTAILFTVSARSIRIHGVSFTGASTAELPRLEEAAKPLLNTDYTRAKIENAERLSFRPVYLQTGHLNASFQETEVKVAQETDDETLVNDTIQVTPGLQYKFADIAWTGNKAFPAEQLQELIRLKPGEPADASELDKDLNEVSALYGTQGYMAAKVLAKPVLDDAAASVHYDLNVEEGEIYKMGDLEVRGLDEAIRNKMTFDWKMLEGQVYDSSYVQRFLKESAKDLPQDVQWKVTPHEAVNDDQTVDVSLLYESIKK